MKTLLMSLFLALYVPEVFAETPWVNDSECVAADGSCDTCAELFGFWQGQGIDRCAVAPQPIGCCYPASSPPPLARADGYGGLVVAPAECQGAGHPAINANPLPHCRVENWSDPNPPTFGGCDYANTEFEDLSVECQVGFNSHVVDLNPPCRAIPWSTYYRVLKQSPDPLNPDSGIQHWLAACRNLEQHMDLVDWLFSQLK